MIAEGNLQQKKGCKLCAYQLILLSNAKKKNVPASCGFIVFSQN